jgi:predicted phosphate transport protein (TIGR00153 family)
MIGRHMEIPTELISNFMKFANECADVCRVASDATNQIDELFQFAFGGNAAEEMQKLLTDLDLMEDRCDETEIILRNELFKIEKDHPPIDVMFLYSVINKIGELADTAETVGHRISLIASK